MPLLTVTNFSCITRAHLDLGKITILIGPQASGKSVLSKLAYFFVDILQYKPRVMYDGVSLEAFKSSLKERFYEWFPLPAWGAEPFVIEFRAGEIEIRLTRTSYRGSITDNFKIWASKSLKAHFSELAEFEKGLVERSDEEVGDLDYQILFDIRLASEKSLKKRMQGDFVMNQFFIPAGRSFFTSVGKAVSAFEHGRTLDPLTLRFGGIYAQLKDRNLRLFGKRAPHSESLEKTLNEILGGEYKIEGEKEFVLTSDGRKVPLSALSSGQQELLPLMSVLPMLFLHRPSLTKKASGKTLLYIEEPEAHLFPHAQSQLIEALSSMSSISRQTLMMVLTTHSPYVLAKFNNLIKAGELERSVKFHRKDELDKVVPRPFRVQVRDVRAYAMIDGVLTSILDEDGLIAADYLDDVSSDISSEFSRLLELEYMQ